MELWHWIGILLGFWLAAGWLQHKLGLDKPRSAPKPPPEGTMITPLTSHPGPCPSCGEVNWARGRLRMIDRSGFRTFEWPTGGVASVGKFVCMNCGSWGKYGMHHDVPEKGWMLLDRYTGGW